jgi:hypothetical protein
MTTGRKKAVAAVAIVEAINAETSHEAKCKARAAIEARWMATGMDSRSKNKTWARIIAISHAAGLTLSPFVYPMPSQSAKAKALRTAREKSAAMIALDADVKAMRSTLKAAEDAHSKALGGIRKMITDRARNCVLEVTLERVLAAFDGPKVKAKAK